jgi:hypothetical protein
VSVDLPSQRDDAVENEDIRQYATSHNTVHTGACIQLRLVARGATPLLARGLRNLPPSLRPATYLEYRPLKFVNCLKPDSGRDQVNWTEAAFQMRWLAASSRDSRCPRRMATFTMLEGFQTTPL